MLDDRLRGAAANGAKCAALNPSPINANPNSNPDANPNPSPNLTLILQYPTLTLTIGAPRSSY